MIKAAIFDMDGLLIDSEPLWRKAQDAGFASVGIHPTIDDYSHTMGRRIIEVVEHWHHKQPWDGPSNQQVADLIVDDLIDFVKEEGQPLPGVQQALELCRELGLKIALASSSSDRIINTTLDKLGIREYFDTIYSADGEEYGKPHPGVFITTAHKLDVSPLACVVFEDAPSGVLAAKAAKMHCIAVPSGHNQQNKIIQIADRVLDSLEQLDRQTLESL
jgi:HAD superfamily hydrolase (TIGR01509 family)